MIKEIQKIEGDLCKEITETAIKYQTKLTAQSIIGCIESVKLALHTMAYLEEVNKR